MNLDGQLSTYRPKSVGALLRHRYIQRMYFYEQLTEVDLGELFVD